MNPSKLVLDQKLAELEQVSNITESEIRTELRKLNLPDTDEEPCREWNYEMLAFSFQENHDNHSNASSTSYYGPEFSGRNADGTHVEYPNLNLVDSDTIDYWSQRLQNTQNPLLKARYSGLVWHLCEQATGNRPHYSVAQISCGAILEIAERDLHKYQNVTIRKLKQAINLALSDQKLIEKTKQTILRYENSIAEDSKPGLWGFSFDFLVGNNRVNLSQQEEQGIINILEDRLQRLANIGDEWSCEQAAERLGRYYRRKGKENEYKRVIRTLGTVFVNAAAKAEPLLAHSLLQHIHSIYIQFNLNKDAEDIARMMHELGPKMQESMGKYSTTVEIPHEEIEKYFQLMLEGSQDEVLTRIAAEYIPRRGEIENQLKDSAQHAPLAFLIPRQISDYSGRILATVGSLDEDLDGHIAIQMSQNMTVSRAFLSHVLNQAISKFCLDHSAITAYIFQSPIFENVQRELIVRGVKAYIEQDYPVAIHLLIPQIEAAIRYIVTSSGGAVLRAGRNGGFLLATLDDLLRSDQMVNAMGNDIALYFRVLLTDQRGWNVRNDVSHGTVPYEYYGKSVADRLVHTLLVLAKVHEKQN